MGSRFELYGNLNSTGQPWSGFMVHATTEEENYSVVHAFPVRVNGDNEFLVTVGQTLTGLVENISEDLNVGATLINTQRVVDLLDTELEGSDASSISARLASTLQEDPAVQNTVITNTSDRILCRMRSFLNQGDSEFCETASQASAAALLPLDANDTVSPYRLVVTS